MLVGEVEVGEGVCLRVLQKLAGAIRAHGELVDGPAVHRPHKLGVALGKDRLERGCGLDLVLLLGEPPPGVALEMDDAALPRRAVEHLPHSRGKPLVRVRDHAPHARHAAPAQAPQERLPRRRRLRVDDAEPDEAPVSVRVAGDGGDHPFALHMSLVAAVHVGCIQPQVRELRAAEVHREQRLHLLVQLGGHARDARRAEGAELERVGGLLYLPGGEPPHIGLLHGRDHRTVHPRVRPYQLVREVRTLAQLRYAHGDHAHDSGKLALAVPVAPVFFTEHLVGLRVHNRVHRTFELQAHDLVEVQRAVLARRQVFK